MWKLEYEDTIMPQSQQNCQFAYFVQQNTIKRMPKTPLSGFIITSIYNHMKFLQNECIRKLYFTTQRINDYY